mmetsp:Transcript_46312/g.148736  ORF Transcript_46312/g.148736 Transcript_46312/m.148736 type:complete len:535 (-) Transcript_46312:313-1917(-)
MTVVAGSGASSDVTTEIAADAKDVEGPTRRCTGRGPALLLLIFTLWQSIFTSGIVYGWPSLLLLLREEGVYAGRCPLGTEDCRERMLALNLVFTLGAMTNVAGGVICGFVVDRLGPKRSLAGGVLVTIVASVVMGLSDASSDVAWPIAFVAYGFGGCLVHLPSFSLGNVFGSSKGFVISSFVSAFSASSLTFWFAYFAYEKGGLSRRSIFLAHAGIEVVNMCISLWLWPSRPLKPGDVLEFSGTGLCVKRDDVGQSGAPPSEPTAGFRRVCRFAASKTFFGFVIFHTVQLWFNRCLMGWFNAELRWKDEVMRSSGGPGLDVSKHMSIFNATHGLIGLSAILVFGWILARFGHRTAPFLATGSLAVIWLTFNLICSEWPLYIVYIFSSWHRQFFFSTFFTFVVSEFPVEVFGQLAGLANLLAGMLSGTQNPLLELTFEDFAGDFTPVLAFQLALAALLCISALAAFCRELQQRRSSSSCSMDTGGAAKGLDVASPQGASADELALQVVGGAKHLGSEASHEHSCATAKAAGVLSL